MKCIIFFLSTTVILLSCSQGIDNGALETESISKKTLEALRTNDFEMYMNLLPDKNTFRKMEDIENSGEEINSTQLSTAFDELNNEARTAFSMVYTQNVNWKNAEYINTSEEPGKADNVNTSLITFKFKVASDVYKIKFTAKKINGLWYSMGDLYWVPKDVATAN